MEGKPWDSRAAHWLMRPLRHTRVHPNHVTTVSLFIGLAAAALYGRGDAASANAGGALFCLSAFLDHADGELARMTGKTSDFGHAYDRLADLVVKIGLFTGMGVGLRGGALGAAAPVFGLLAGLSLVAIFLMRSRLARLQGWQALDQPGAGGFEIEDILYAVAPITWLGWLEPFVVAAAVGAPLFALWTARRLRAAVRRRGDAAP